MMNFVCILDLDEKNCWTMMRTHPKMCMCGALCDLGQVICGVAYHCYGEQKEFGKGGMAGLSVLFVFRRNMSSEFVRRSMNKEDALRCLPSVCAPL